jgi:hypothetical protein
MEAVSSQDVTSRYIECPDVPGSLMSPSAVQICPELKPVNSIFNVLLESSRSLSGIF